MILGRNQVKQSDTMQPFYIMCSCKRWDASCINRHMVGAVPVRRLNSDQDFGYMKTSPEEISVDKARESKWYYRPEHAGNGDWEATDGNPNSGMDLADVEI